MPSHRLLPKASMPSPNIHPTNQGQPPFCGSPPGVRRRRARATVVGVVVLVVTIAVIIGAVAFGLVWTLRALGPDVPEEPE